jgi:hypothetical protein
MVLTITPKGLFSQNYLITVGDKLLTELTPLRMKESVECTLNGRVYRITHPQLMAGDWVMESAEGIAVEAAKPSPTSRSLLLRRQGRIYELAPHGVTGRADELRYEGEVIGRFAPQSLNSRNFVLETVVNLPPDLLVCVVWMSLLRLAPRRK